MPKRHCPPPDVAMPLHFKFYPISIPILNHADTFHGSTVFIAADLDTGLRTAGMDDLSSADIDCYMVDVTFAVTVEYQISGL